MAFLMQGIAREILSIKLTMVKIQKFVMNVQALLNTSVKQVQGLEERVPASKDWVMARQTSSHKELQGPNGKILDLKGRSRR